MKAPQKNVLEWSLFAASLLLVLAALGFLGWRTITQENGQPDLDIVLGEPQPHETGLYLIPVTINNRGDHSVTDVHVEVELLLDGEVVETGELTFPLVPFGSAREGVVRFSQDPAGGELKTRLTSYLNP